MENEMDRACNVHRREEEYIQGYDGKAKRKYMTRNTYM
jgi:hypothetical protein